MKDPSHYLEGSKGSCQTVSLPLGIILPFFSVGYIEVPWSFHRRVAEEPIGQQLSYSHQVEELALALDKTHLRSAT